MSVKKILFLTINFPPNPSVGTHRVSKILKYLNHSRYKVTVLTLKEKYYDLEIGAGSGDAKKIPASVQVVRSDRSDLTYAFTKIKSLFGKIRLKKKRKAPSSKTVASGKTHAAGQASSQNSLKSFVYKVRDFIFAIFEFPDKYIGWLPNAVRQGVRLIKENQIEAIFTTAPPHSLFLMAMLIKKFTGAKLILDFRDPWALSRWDKGSPVKYFLEKRLEKRAIKAADLLLFVTENLQEEYVRNYAWAGPEKFKLFSNGFDPDDFKNITMNDKQNQQSPYRFVHLGTLYKKRDPGTLLQAAAELISENKLDAADIQIDFIGIVARELNRIYSDIKRFNLENVVRFIPPVSFAESIQTMYDADVLLLIQPGTDLQIPAKLFEYMYTRKPILAIAEPDSATDRMINAGNLGVFTPSKEVQKIKTAVLEIINYTSSGKKPDEKFIQSYDYSSYIKVFEEYFESV